MSAAGVVPHRLLALKASEAVIFARARELAKKGSKEDPDLVQQEVSLQRKRLQAFEAAAPQVRAYYSLTFDNIRDIDATRSAWAVYDQALQETSTSVSQRLEYYRRTSQGMAANVYGLCFTASRMASSESEWRNYCPVSLTLGNELMAVQDPQCIVEYKSKLYCCASKEKAALFVADPESYLQIPLPASVPRLLTPSERNQGGYGCALEDYCPVALVDRQEPVKGSGHHVVMLQGKFYSCENTEAATKLLRRPMRYVQRAKLPSKRPAIQGEQTVSLVAALTKSQQDNRSLEPADMLTFMQASVAEVICQALVEAGERRPLLPGSSPMTSALLFLARFLRAKNPINTELQATKVRLKLEELLADCDLPRILAARTEQQENKAAWTHTDEQQMKELCARFDKVFKVSF